MTPKEKAKELIDKYVKLTNNWVYGIKNWEHKKQCALIAVDEILSIELIKESVDNYYLRYWKEVKKEIEKL